MQPIDTTRAHCVDPETLAAWVDGGLAAPAAAEVEAHLSTCARCQAILAALSATEPASPGQAPAVILPFWSRRPVQWAAAALAVAASITLWTMNRPEPEPAPIAVPQSTVAQAPVVTTSPAPPTPTPTAPARRAASKPAAAESVAAPAPPPAPAAPAPPPPQPSFPPVNPATTLTGGARNTAFGASAEVLVQGAQFEVIAATNQNSPATAMRLNTRSAGRGGGGGRAGTIASGAPTRPPVRWRVNGTAVERSDDAGQSWERLDLDPPFTLTAGSAPYQDVCWLVGQDGVVFRTTNGTSFERMTPPDKVHLRVIVAIDALRAAVTAVDGRMFETADGGVTWKPRVFPRG